jgi:hypothetical protein
MFLDCFKTNYVFDVGFRYENKDIKLCWCPWLVFNTDWSKVIIGRLYFPCFHQLLYFSFHSCLVLLSQLVHVKLKARKGKVKNTKNRKLKTLTKTYVLMAFLISDILDRIYVPVQQKNHELH